MKQLQKSDLKESDIYVSDPSYDNSHTYLNKHSLSGRGFGLNLTFKNDFKSDWHLSYNNMREATPEEKHWLETCIKADQFVSYEDAMKTFIPEYVECINPSAWRQTIKENNGNLIFKSDFKSTCYVQILEVLPQSESFKPSTKEAYDAQFKEPEFVLPKRWHIKVNSEEESVIYKKFFKKVKPKQNWKFWINFVYGFDGIDYNNYYFNSKLITFEQFKQYVLKENTTITEKPKVVFEESKDKVLLHFNQSSKTTIKSVQCSEGGVYKIDDKITVFDKTSPNKGKPFTIKSFRWSNDKSKICAITELHTPNGIGLDKIELYIEPKVEPKQELSLLEQAKSRYPIGTKFRVAHLPHIICKVKDHENYYFQTDEIINLNIEVPIDGCFGGCVYYKGKWAEIVDDFVLPEKWYIKLTVENRKIVIDYINKNTNDGVRDGIIGIYYGYNGKHCTSIFDLKNTTEITLEQFKKYVLKNE